MVTARLLGVSVALGVLVAGCRGSTDTPAEVAPTSIVGLDSAAMNLVRVKFCDLVPEASIRSALSETPTASRTWGNGDPVPGTSSDVAHELGCSWSAPSGSTARAWVFARPVSAAFARGMVGSSSREDGCRGGTVRGFGTPALVQICPQPGNARRVRFAGLFGDTWLTCEVTSHTRAAELRTRADTWCAAVATALDTAR